MVSVDKELDKHPKGIMMRLRPSMKKFNVKDKSKAEIEIAGSFEGPNRSHFNRQVKSSDTVSVC
jgi:RNA-dependent RNA polymerase